MALINILAIENPIVDILRTIDSVEHVYRESLADELTADSVCEPVITVANAGYTVKSADNIVGCTNSQVITSLWTVAVVCLKEDYLTKASVIQMEIINKLKGYKHKDWRFRMRVGTDVRNFSKPDIDVRIAFYPMVFSVDVII